MKYHTKKKIMNEWNIKLISVANFWIFYSYMKYEKIFDKFNGTMIKIFYWYTSKMLFKIQCTK